MGAKKKKRPTSRNEGKERKTSGNEGSIQQMERDRTEGVQGEGAQAKGAAQVDAGDQRVAHDGPNTQHVHEENRHGYVHGHTMNDGYMSDHGHGYTPSHGYMSDHGHGYTPSHGYMSDHGHGYTPSHGYKSEYDHGYSPNHAYMGGYQGHMVQPEHAHTPYYETVPAADDYGKMAGYATLTEPYVLQSLYAMRGQKIVVQTARGTVRGVLCDVYPDHIVIDVHRVPFFVRIQEILWFIPSHA